MKVLLANPRGFCAGVDRAIDIVERALEFFGPPIYVRHEVVHNRHVVERLRALGAVFVDELAEVPDGATVIFSAHGVSSAVEEEAHGRNLTVFDATCPLVTKVHMEVQRYAREGRDVLLIGHAEPPGGREAPWDASMRAPAARSIWWRAWLTWPPWPCATPSASPSSAQTTLSVDDTAGGGSPRCGRAPSLAAPRREDICYATQNRQDAVKKLLEQCDVLLVVGSRTSSNSNRLRELADRVGIPGYLVDGPADLQPGWFTDKRAVGVTAGASAPELLVRQVVEQLRAWGGEAPAEVAGRAEHVVFTLPRELRRESEKPV